MRAPATQLSSFGPKGSWAIVTGASDGIGAEFAMQLAAAGFSVALVSRTRSKLDTLASTLHSKYNVQTDAHAIDFARASDADYESLDAFIADLPGDVAILVNNVGVSHAMPVRFAQTERAEADAIVSVNVTATLRVTSFVLPRLLDREGGLILTVGSFAGLIPTPLLATYSGSKAFLQHWSSALGDEVAARGIAVQLVQSYLVTSAMSKVRRASALVPTPRAFVRSALASVGRTGGAQGFAYAGTPYWSHALMQWGVGALLGGFTGGLAVGQNRVMHEAIRKRALRKVEREGGKKSA